MKTRRRVCALSLAALLCSAASHALDARDANWPPFLPAPAEVPNAEAVRAVWAEATFERRVDAPPIRVPGAIYVALIDAPDILAAGANHLGLTNESAEAMPDGSFELRSPDGSFASYRVILYEPNRRVIFSQGRLLVFGLGVRAAVLGVLAMSSSGDRLQQQLKVFVRVENPVLSWLTHAVSLVLPSIADKELLRGFQLAHEVAEWAANDRHAFCTWLSARPRTTRAQDVGRAVGCTDMLSPGGN